MMVRRRYYVQGLGVAALTAHDALDGLITRRTPDRWAAYSGGKILYTVSANGIGVRVWLHDGREGWGFVIAEYPDPVHFDENLAHRAATIALDDAQSQWTTGAKVAVGAVATVTGLGLLFVLKRAVWP